MGVTPPKTSDRRVRRTRAALREALISLMLQRGWDEVSVQDVCDVANVGRSTFYTHFADKDELVAGGFEDLRRMLRTASSQASRAGPLLPFVPGLIAHAHEHQRLFRALVGKNGGQVVLRRFRESLLTLVREDLAALARPRPATDAVVHFIAGAFFELLRWWIERPDMLDPAEVERLFFQMAGPAVELALG